MRLSILIAEDSPVDRMLLSTIVGKQGTGCSPPPMGRKRWPCSSRSGRNWC